MPNGYRRGGSVTRNGRTFQRRGTKIAGPKASTVAIAFGGLVVGSMLIGGSPLLAHPVVLTGAVVGVAAVLIGAHMCRKHIGGGKLKHTMKRQAKRVGKRAAKKTLRTVNRRWKARQRKAAPTAPRPAVRRRTAPAQRDPWHVPQVEPDDNRHPELFGPPKRGGGRMLS